MTGKKTVILVAWEDETKSLSDSDKQRLDDNNIEIVYTGIGKINATRVTTDLIVRNQYGRLADSETRRRLGLDKPLRIVNVGCAGSHTTGVRTLIKPNHFIQRDMDARQFGYEQYRTPEEHRWIIDDTFVGYPLHRDGHFRPLLDTVCATGDNANGYSETSDEVPAFDAVDMEASAIAAVCTHYGVSFTCYKWITDLAAEDSTIEELIENNKLLPWTQIIDEILLLD